MAWWSAALVGARFVGFGTAALLCGWPCFCLYAGDCRPRAASTTAVLLLAAAIVWTLAESVLLQDQPDTRINMAAVFALLTDTRFGRAALLRMVLGMVYLALVGRPRSRVPNILLTLLGAAILTSFAWSGHGAAGSGAGGTLHLAADVVHLLAAGLWIGALPPLAIMAADALRSDADADARAVHAALAGFSLIGMVTVAALAVSGIVNSWYLIGPADWRVLGSNSYTVTLGLKLILFGAMLALAANHRLRLLPRLNAGLGEPGRHGVLRRLRSSLWFETGLGLLVLGAVAVLGTLVPPASM